MLLAKWMYRAQREAGLKVTGGIHILRPTFCSRLAMARATPVAISTMAGHKSLSTTQRYLHLAPAATDQAIALLDKETDLAAAEPRKRLRPWSRTAQGRTRGLGRHRMKKRPGSIELPGLITCRGDRI